MDVTFLELKHISKQFGKMTAVDQIDLKIERGEFLTLLGPSGCGKTTIMRMIAGFETPDSGSILLEDEDITYSPANKRPMGMVFQSYALFPHMTAEQNIAFGLKIKRLANEEIKRRCSELLELVNLGDKGQSYPHQLSGGQQQRIALARALAVEPKLILLDEPLSALDAKVRMTLRDEIRRIQQQLKMTAIYVTHDQEEALAISDRIAVMAKGHIEQLDQPEEIYSHPRSVFAATFVGHSNRFTGVLTSAHEGRCQVEQQEISVAPQPQLADNSRVMLLVRPEAVSVQDADTAENANINSGLNILTGTIQLRSFLGPFTRFTVQTASGALLTADIPSQQARALYVAQSVQLIFPPEACQVLPMQEASVESKVEVTH